MQIMKKSASKDIHEQNVHTLIEKIRNSEAILVGAAAGIANSHFLRTAGPHFPDSPGHIKRTTWDISRAEGTPPY